MIDVVDPLGHVVHGTVVVDREVNVLQVEVTVVSSPAQVVHGTTTVVKNGAVGTLDAVLGVIDDDVDPGATGVLLLELEGVLVVRTVEVTGTLVDMVVVRIVVFMLDEQSCEVTWPLLIVNVVLQTWHGAVVVMVETTVVLLIEVMTVVTGTGVLVTVTVEPLLVVVKVTGLAIKLLGVGVLVVVIVDPLLVVVKVTGLAVELLEAAATGVDRSICLAPGEVVDELGAGAALLLPQAAVTVTVDAAGHVEQAVVTVTVAVGPQTELDPEETTAVTVMVLVTVDVTVVEVVVVALLLEVPVVELAELDDELLLALAGAFMVTPGRSISQLTLGLALLRASREQLKCFEIFVQSSPATTVYVDTVWLAPAVELTTV